MPVARFSPSPATSAIIGAIVCTSIFALTIGLTYPLLSFVLKAQGYGDAAIGINAAMTALGVMLASPFYPRVIKRFGSWQVASICLVATGTLILLMGLTQQFAAFLILRFLLGVVDAGVYIVSETWINQLAERRSRGRIVGLYATSLSAGFALGPLILAFTGPESMAPFLIGAAMCGLAVAGVLAIRKLTPDVKEERAVSSLSFVWLAPTLLLAVTVFAFWDAAILALYPVFGLDLGLDAAFIAVSLSVCILGNTFFQIPIGWLADKTSRRAILILCCFLAAFGALALPWAINDKLLFLPLLFFWGASAGGIYTMSMTELGDRFDGAELVAGNAAFAVAFGVGGVVGGPIVGMAMRTFGPNGFSGSLALVLFATALFAIWRSRWSASST